MGPEDGRVSRKSYCETVLFWQNIVRLLFQKKVISKEERKIVDQANGIPERPLTAFTIFVKDYNQKHPGEADLFKHAAHAWANLNEKEKSRYAKIQQKVRFCTRKISISNPFEYISFQSFNEFKEKAEEYIRKLPLHEQLAARKALQVTGGKKRKAAPSATTKSDANGAKSDDEYGSDEHEPAPAKKIKREEPDEDFKIPAKSGKSQKAAEPSKMAQVMEEPEIPIQRGECGLNSF